MKRLKSLALSFAVAASAFVGVGTANAQTVPAHPQAVQQTQYTTSHFNRTLTKEGVDDVAYTFGAERVFRNVGAGYTDRISPLTGERIGLEFSVYNGQATVRAAYNLNDRAQYNQYLINKGNDASMDTQMALTQMQMPFGIYAYPSYPTYPVYHPPRHVHGPAILLPPIIIGGGHHDGHRGNDHDRGRWDNNRGNDHRGGDHRGGDRDHRGPGHRGPGR